MFGASFNDSPGHKKRVRATTTAINAALQEANEKQITGKAITPFLLNEMLNATQGKSLKANIALIKNNVVLAAQLARALSG